MPFRRGSTTLSASSLSASTCTRCARALRTAYTARALSQQRQEILYSGIPYIPWSDRPLSLHHLPGRRFRRPSLPRRRLAHHVWPQKPFPCCTTESSTRTLRIPQSRVSKITVPSPAEKTCRTILYNCIVSKSINNYNDSLACVPLPGPSEAPGREGTINRSPLRP